MDICYFSQYFTFNRMIYLQKKKKRLQQDVLWLYCNKFFRDFPFVSEHEGWHVIFAS